MDAWLIDSTYKRRDKLYIIAEIMDISQAGALKTQIMYKANLSFAQLGEYLKLLQRINLLERIEDNGKEMYKATEKGLDFLQRQCELTELLKTEEEKPRNGVRIPPANLLRKS